LTSHHPAVWAVFGALIAGLLAVDLFVIGRARAAPSLRTLGRWTVAVVVAALLFGGYVFLVGGTQKALEYYAGYLIELSLSVDNLFVFLLIFRYFAVPPASQTRVLMWGVVTAIVLRGLMVVAGVVLLARFEWIIYLLGAVLVFTAVKMLRDDDIQIAPERNPLVRLARRVLPITKRYHDDAFLIKRSTGLLATPLVLVLLVVEWSDVTFAIDSIPAIFSVTRDPFIVFSSNIFAVLGLRAMFFVLADLMRRFVYLKPGVAIILGFVGVKMLLSAWIHPPVVLSLAVILTVLVVAVLLSVRRARREGGLVSNDTGP
jgi:TerC family integral membrane protein